MIGTRRKRPLLCLIFCATLVASEKCLKTLISKSEYALDCADKTNCNLPYKATNIEEECRKHHISQLDLSGNNLINLSSVINCKKLIHLDLSHTNIKKLDQLENLILLEYLDLSYNNNLNITRNCDSFKKMKVVVVVEGTTAQKGDYSECLGTSSLLLHNGQILQQKPITKDTASTSITYPTTTATSNTISKNTSHPQNVYQPSKATKSASDILGACFIIWMFNVCWHQWTFL